MILHIFTGNFFRSWISTLYFYEFYSGHETEIDLDDATAFQLIL